MGILASAARPPDRHRLSRPAAVVHCKARITARPRGKAVRHIPVGGVAGRIGLVHGEKRPRRRSACLAIPSHGAPRPGAGDLRSDVLGRAFARVSRSSSDGIGVAALRANVGGRRDDAHLRDGALRRTGRRHPGRLRLQHVSADERPPGAARHPRARAMVAELLLEHGDGAVRSPVYRIAHRRARAGVVVEAADLRAKFRRARAGADICCSPSSWPRLRLESRRCFWSFRCRLRRCTRRVPCSSWRQRSTSRTRCARPRSSAAAVPRFAVAPMGVPGDHRRFRRLVAAESPQ